jgi:hypothetical protein
MRDGWRVEKGGSEKAAWRSKGEGVKVWYDDDTS